MRMIATVLGAVGIVALMAMPAGATTQAPSNGLQNRSGIEKTEFSSQRRHYRHRHHGYRRYYGPRRYYGYRGPRYWGPRYGYYRPYGYYGRPYYRPGVSLGFGGGPRFGVWF